MGGTHRQRITVAVMPDGNLMRLERSGDGKAEFSGVEGRFLNIVLSYLGLPCDFVIPKDREFGKMLPDGNWSGLVGMVQRGEADLAYNHLSITEQRSQVVGFSSPYAFDELTFISHTPSNRKSIFTFLYPFDLSTWLSLLFIFCLISALLALCKNRILSTGDYVYRLFGSSLGQSVRIEDSSVKFNLLVIFWLFSFQVIAFSYSGKLLSFLIEPLKEGAIRNFAQLSKAVQSGSHQASFDHLAAQHLLTYHEEHLFQLGKIVASNNWVLNVTHLNPETYIRPNLCLGLYRNFAKYLFGTRDDVYFSEDRLNTVVFGFAYSESFCCISKLNTIIYRATSAGLYDKFLKDESLKLFLRFFKRSEIFETVSPLSSEDILGPMTLLSTGLSLSFVIFLVEVLHSKYAK